MNSTKEFTSIRSLLEGLAKSMNLISTEMEHHHEQTAYLAFHIGRELGLKREELHMTVVAALLHDVGSIMIQKPLKVQEIEQDRRSISAAGARMIRDLKPFAGIASAIQFCQNSYADNKMWMRNHLPCAVSCLDISEAIHIADFVSLIWDDSKPILNQVSEIRNQVEALRGSEFSDRGVAAFERVSRQEFLWMDFALNPSFLLLFTGNMHIVSLQQTAKLTKLMTRIIDFRSPFTAMHSAGVSASAKTMAKLAGMDADTCIQMEIAGNLHDVGKLRVPNAILEKPGKLTDEEFNIVKEHPYYTRLILKDVEGFGNIANWAGYHHEKLNGRGYPFHFDREELDTGSRIMAVADIFSAITEERPYRKPMSREEALNVMKQNVETGGIDGDLVALLAENYKAINEARLKASTAAGKRYRQQMEEEKNSTSIAEAI